MSNTELSKLRLSAAYLLGMAVLDLHKDAKLGTCGVTDSGFYYDIEFSESMSSEGLPAIQQKIQEFVKSNLKFTLSQKNKEEVISYFTEKEQPYKREVLDESSAKRVGVVSIGDGAFMDLSDGDVVAGASVLKHTILLDVSGAYWKGDDKRAMLTRISGTCFETAEALDDFVEFTAEVLRRDHRIMGKKLGYFSVDPGIGTGLIFWTPRGRFVRDSLADYLKGHMIQLGAELVETPLLASTDRTTLMMQPQSEQLIARQIGEDSERSYAVRQQVVGAHLTMFGWQERSYRELPWKVGEIGKLIRYEKISELEGLHRAREFTQDTITTVCSREQIEKEIESLLLRMVQFSRDLGFWDFEIQYRLPKQETKTQKTDYQLLAAVLKGISRKHSITITEEVTERKVTEAEIVLSVKDSLKQKRRWSKIQILFTLPMEYEVTYVGSDGENHAPVVIRSTTSGSLERVIATLIEHYAGVLPLWLTYEPVRVLPVTSKQELYAEKVVKILKDRGLRATIDMDPEPLEGKIKQAEEDKVPYMIVVGENEQTTNTISVRVQGHGVIGLLDIETFIKDIQGEMQSKSFKSALV
ncbi:threonine--tRNA ligase [bacterium]|nr:threonine--tRNA ligase [bacterium]